MKRLAMIALVLPFLIGSMAQAQRGTWGPWTPVNGFPQLQLSTKCTHYNKSAQKWHWVVRFKSGYSDTIHFSYKVTEQTVRRPNLSQRTSVRPGQQKGGGFALLTTRANSRVWVGKVTYGRNALFARPYAKPYESPREYRRRAERERARGRRRR